MAGSKDCVFCRIAAKEIAAKIVFEDDRVVAFEDSGPQAPVHILIVPKDHIGKASDLNGTHTALIGELFLAAKEIAKTKGVEGSGYRIVLNCGRDAGQAVGHIHLHLLGGRKFAWPPG